MYNDLSNYFDEATRTVLKEGVAAWHALKKHDDWNHWLRVGAAIAQAQDIAADATQATSGRNFNAFMATCYSKPSYLGEFADIDKSDRSRAARCWREREQIEKFRQSIGQTRALRLNNPKAVLDAFDASRRMPSDKREVASPFQKTKQELTKALEQIDALKKEQGGEISFSYRDSHANIAKLLISSLGDRLPSVLAEITKQRKR